MFPLSKTIFFCSAFLLVCFCSTANADVIDFDSLTTGTTVTNQFQSQGVLFSRGSNGNPVIITRPASQARSFGNQLHGGRDANGGSGSIIIDFVLPGTSTSTTASNVSFVVFDSQRNTGSSFAAQAFDINGALLETLIGNNSGNTTLSFSVSSINRVIIQRPFDLEGIDDLNFTINGTVTAVPEPATMLLLGTGLAGVSAAVRKRRKS